MTGDGRTAFTFNVGFNFAIPDVSRSSQARLFSLFGEQDTWWAVADDVVSFKYRDPRYDGMNPRAALAELSVRLASVLDFMVDHATIDGVVALLDQPGVLTQFGGHPATRFPDLYPGEPDAVRRAGQKPAPTAEG